MMKKNQVLIDCTCCTGRISGLERYTIEVVNRLIKLDPTKYQLVLAKSNFGINHSKIDSRFVHVSPFDSRLLNEWLFLPWIYLKVRSGKFFFPGFPPSLFFLFVKAKLIRTVYDVVVWRYPETISFKTKYYTKILETIFIHRHSFIFTISQNAANLIKEEFPNIKAPIVNTYLGVSLNEKEDIVFEENTPFKREKFILSVGTIEPRKNYPFLIKAFAGVVKKFPDLKLIIAGRYGWGIDEVQKTINHLDLEKSVVLAGAVSDLELERLYTECEFFVYPSIYEGFGLPAIEAIAKNKFIISSNKSSLPEVVGKAGVLLSIDNEEEWTNKIEEVISQPERFVISDKIRSEHLSQFNWDEVGSCIQDKLELV